MTETLTQAEYDALLRQDFERRVVQDFPVLHDAAVAVVGVLAQADVSDH